MKENEWIREELIHTVAGLSDEQLNAHPEEGRWSVAQVMEHLYLMEGSITKGISHTLASEESRPAEDKPISATLNRDIKVKAPSFVEPSDSFRSLSELKEMLSESRNRFNQVVEQADPSELEQKSFPHPMFKNLSLKQWISFVGLHEKRHLMQIEELIMKLN